VVVENGRILLVPHYETDAGEIQWTVPGGMVEFGEALETAVTREVFEETGLRTEVTGVLCVSEVILPERPYHSITISFTGKAIGGDLRAEENHPYGTKTPRWFSATELGTERYHPEKAVALALGINRR
jgi:ADP-ribose pyrophosphatase YjhB (NUDIX family)